jgi:hypothetical protein
MDFPDRRELPECPTQPARARGAARHAGSIESESLLKTTPFYDCRCRTGENLRHQARARDRPLYLVVRTFNVSFAAEPMPGGTVARTAGRAGDSQGWRA